MLQALRDACDVLRLVDSRVPFPEACYRVAKRRGVAPQTTRDGCTRRYGLKAADWDGADHYVARARIGDVLLRAHPDYLDTIRDALNMPFFFTLAPARLGDGPAPDGDGVPERRTNASKTMARQGDFLAIRLSDAAHAPPKIRITGYTLSEGEATGHTHEIEAADRPYCTVWATALPDLLIVAVASVGVVHPEHGRIRLEAGTWLVRRQRSFDPVLGRVTGGGD